MLRPQDTATRERKALDGLWRFRLDVDGVGRAERWFAGRSRDAQDDGRARQLQRHARRRRASRDHVGDVWYQTDGPRAARLGGRARRPALRVGDAPGHGLGGRRRRSSGTRAATRRSRPTSPRTSRAGRGGADHRRGRQHAELPDHPAGRRRGHARRQAPAVLARLLQLRRPAPLGVAVLHARGPRRRTSPSSPASTAPTGTVDVPGGGRRRRRARGAASCCATPTAREVAHRRPARAAR